MQKYVKETETPRMQSEMLTFVDMFFQTLTARLDPNAPQIDPSRIKFIHEVSADTIKAWVQKTQVDAAGKPLPAGRELQTLAPAEAFMAYIKISFIAGLILTCPWVFYQLWMFVAAGLYPQERRYIHVAIPFSAGMFVIGALFFLFVVAPMAFNFFLNFGAKVVGVASNWTLQQYISFVTVMMLVFGLAFQTPIAVFILVRTGLVSVTTLRNVRKYVLLGMAFVAAVATPGGDLYSLILLLIPLYSLYELGILLAAIAEKKAKRKELESA
jgi:sec-independent protein translocase protein TatC